MMILRLTILTIFLLAGSFISAFGAESIKFKPLTAAYQDQNNIPLKYPEGVTWDKSTVFVADTGNARIVRYNLVNDDLKDGTEIKIEQLTSPIRLKMTVKGDLLALDGKSHKIARINNGTLVGFLDPQKVTSPEDFVPRSMAVDSKDNIYLADILGERILVLDPAGVFIRNIPFPAGYGYIADVTVDSKGNVFIIDSFKSEVLRAAPSDTSFTSITKDLDTYLYFAVSIDTDPLGRIYLLDQNDNGLVIVGQDGKFLGRFLNGGWKTGQLDYPAQGSLSNNGIYAIADRNNNRLQLFKKQ